MDGIQSVKCCATIRDDVTLAKAEHELELLQSDVQRLQNRLQKAHHDDRSLVNQNQWFEKQQS